MSNTGAMLDAQIALQNAVKSCYDNFTSGQDMDQYDYMNQPFILLDPHGGQDISSTMSINALQTNLITSAAIFAAQLGAAAAIAVVLLIMTDHKKRQSLSFIFNMLALICDIIRCILQCAQLNSAISKFPVVEMTWFDAPGIDNAMALSISGSIFTFLLFVFIELALIIQVRVVCAAASHVQREAVTISTVCIGLLAIAFRINLTIINIHGVVHLGDITEDSQAVQSRAQKLANISGIVSISIFSLIFCFKLAMAIRSRRAMGLTQFGPMQIIFIMGCQTLILPAIFAALAYYALPGAQVQSAVETTVAIFLPLSSIWASANTNARLQTKGHAAVIALPEYKPKKERGHSSVATLVNTLDASDGLQADERRYKSKYDFETSNSSASIDKYLGGFDRDVEMQRRKLSANELL